MTWFVILDANGDPVSITSALPDDLPEGTETVKIDALPDERRQRWDRKARAWIDDPALVLAADEASADETVAPEAIRDARLIKQVEASLVLAGIRFAGLIHAEAEAKGIAPEDLARTVLTEAEAFRAAEVARVTTKHQARAVLASVTQAPTKQE